MCAICDVEARQGVIVDNPSLLTNTDVGMLKNTTGVERKAEYSNGIITLVNNITRMQNPVGHCQFNTKYL